MSLRRISATAAVVCAMLLAVPMSALAATGSASAAAHTSKLSLTAKITSFHATRAGVVATGVFSGTLRSGTGVSRNSAPVRFAVSPRPAPGSATS